MCLHLSTIITMDFQQYISKTLVDRKTGMISLPLVLYIIVISQIDIECFYIPQPYHVKLYHHENMLLIGQNDSQESFLYSLEATDGQEKTVEKKGLQLKARGIRSTEDMTVIPEDSSYEDQSQYQATLQPNEASGIVNNHSYEYDYERFKTEYYQEEGSSGMQNKSTKEAYNNEYHEGNESKEINLNKTQMRTAISNIPMENYCSVVLFFRLRVLECFLYGISQKNDDITRRSEWVLIFWTVLYVIIAGYFWCTKGWCFCCCPCACCHPHDVIQDAKQFLAQNPPGVAQLHSRRKVYYETSEYERQCYTALENDVFNF